MYGRPDIFNNDQGSQFTSIELKIEFTSFWTRGSISGIILTDIGQ